jgi:ribosomal protein S18 acetylase RimI-like enzyme
MIRPTVPADTPILVKIAEETGVFKPLEIVALKEVLEDYHGENEDHICITYEREGEVLGFAYFAPAAMTDRTWHLYWIAVNKKLHARGIGTDLLRRVEETIRQKKARQLLIETSSLPHYEPTRRFYLKHGYEKAGVQPDYYADGDDMIIFRKCFH